MTNNSGNNRTGLHIVAELRVVLTNVVTLVLVPEVVTTVVVVVVDVIFAVDEVEVVVGAVIKIWAKLHSDSVQHSALNFMLAVSKLECTQFVIQPLLVVLIPFAVTTFEV